MVLNVYTETDAKWNNDVYVYVQLVVFVWVMPSQTSLTYKNPVHVPHNIPTD